MKKKYSRANSRDLSSSKYEQGDTIQETNSRVKIGTTTTSRDWRRKGVWDWKNIE